MAKDSIKIDFGKEEESGSRVKWKAGDYHVKIVKVKAGRSSDKDTPYIGVTFKVLEGPKKGQSITEHLYITPKSMKRVRMLLEACGIKVPKKVVNLRFDKLKNKKLWIEVEDDDSGVEKGYKVKSTVAFEGFMSEDSYEGPDDEDEEDEDDDEDEDEDEDDEDEDEDEDEEDEDEEEDEDDDEDDDDEDEDEEPVKKKKSKAKAKKKAPAKKSSKSKKKGKKNEDLEELDLDEL